MSHQHLFGNIPALLHLRCRGDLDKICCSSDLLQHIVLVPLHPGPSFILLLLKRCLLPFKIACESTHGPAMDSILNQESFPSLFSALQFSITPKMAVFGSIRTLTPKRASPHLSPVAHLRRLTPTRIGLPSALRPIQTRTLPYLSPRMFGTRVWQT